MKKKLFSSVLALLAVTALAACGNKSDTGSSASSSVSESSAASKTEQSSSSAAVSEPLLTDDEIAAAQTVGDFKALFTKLADGYWERTQALAEKLPASDRETYRQNLQDTKDTLETAKANFNSQIAQVGDDSVVIPEGERPRLTQPIINARNAAQAVLEAADLELESSQ
ncbi:hypothetical protein ACVRXQ_12910 [Streptococcus panodentis]|uniref:Lipoprotein n=1 Tax=Streptococcus panodentis TaxID=1581472 RepID=A0ABS5B0X0_9STRE|nr:hypothetical protein [Streptococcus panodentis]MBP2622151.1 hypothetical protein [Streptococcus panodentis]